MKKYLALCIALSTMNAIAAEKTNLKNVEIKVQKQIRVLDPDTSKWDIKTEKLSDSEIEELINASEIRRDWSTVSGYDVGAALAYMFGGHGGPGGPTYSDHSEAISNDILRLKDGKIAFVSTKKDNLKYTGIVGLKIAKHNYTKCDDLAFTSREKSTVLNCYEDIVAPLTRHFSHATSDLEFLRDKTLDNLDYDLTSYSRKMSDCEIGFDLSLDEIMRSQEEVQEACNKSNFRDCSKEQSLVRTVAKDLKLSVFNRSTGNITEEPVNVITRMDDYRYPITEFINKEGRVVMARTRTDLSHESCGSKNLSYK